MSDEFVLWEQDGGVGRITLNRPETRNAWNTDFGDRLTSLIENEAADPSVRAVLITGAGKGFSSGADLKGGFHPAYDGLPDIRRELHVHFHPIMTGVRALEKPVVAAVHGAAVGIGCSLALSCDLILASESAYFGLAFVNIGLFPDGGSTAFVPVAVGKARALEMAMLGERLPAPKALDWGLINQVHPDDELNARADELVAKLATGPTLSYAATKRAINASVFANLDAQLTLEADTQHRLARTSDFVEGVTAFAEKREPSFKGT